MRDWRSTLISALALPTSVIATFFFMWAVGFTINMMTLMALSLVIGILIDDAVVVRENIYRHMEHGEDPFTAARKGTAEIGLAVMATTFTILAVFLPVGFMTGIVGQFFKSFALTIAFAVAMSLLVAFTLDPMLSSRFVRYVPPEERIADAHRAHARSVGPLLRPRSTGATIACSAGRSGNPWKVLGVAAVVFFASLSTLGVIGTEFVPQEDRGQFEVHRGAAARHVVRAERRGRERAREAGAGRFPKCGRSSRPLASTAMRSRPTSRSRRRPKHERERGLLALKADARQRVARGAAHQVDRHRSGVHAGRADRRRRSTCLCAATTSPSCSG